VRGVCRGVGRMIDKRFLLDADSSDAATTGVVALLRATAQTIEDEHPDKRFEFDIEIREVVDE